MLGNFQSLSTVPQASLQPQSLHALPDISTQLDFWTTLYFDIGQARNGDDGHKRIITEDENTTTNGQQGLVYYPGHVDNHIDRLMTSETNITQARPSRATTIYPQHIAPRIPPSDSNNSLTPCFPTNFHIPKPLPITQPITSSAPQLLALHRTHNSSCRPLFLPHSNHHPAQHQYPTNPITPGPPSVLSPSTHVTTSNEPPTNPPNTPSIFNSNTAPSERLSLVHIHPKVLHTLEDKRHRNTAASARFRLRKKEKEATLEGKVRDLEAKVGEWEKEYEGLRRENEWLRGLIAGVNKLSSSPGPATPPTPLPDPITPQIYELYVGGYDHGNDLGERAQ